MVASKVDGMKGPTCGNQVITREWKGKIRILSNPIPTQNKASGFGSWVEKISGSL